MSERSLRDLNAELEYNCLERIHMTQDDEQFHDVWLTYTNHKERIPSVEYLLKLQSEYFKAVFQRWNKDNNRDLHLPYDENIPLDIFRVLHNSVFTPSNFNVNDLKLPEKFDLFCLSNFYRFEDVEKVMNKYLVNSITPENCWHLLCLSANYGQNGLGDECGNFISQRIRNLASNNELFKLDRHSLAFLLQRDTFFLREEIIFEIALAWRERNPDEDITLIRNSIRIQLAMNGDVRQQMINWCGREPNENDSRKRRRGRSIANLDYFS